MTNVMTSATLNVAIPTDYVVSLEHFVRLLNKSSAGIVGMFKASAGDEVNSGVAHFRSVEAAGNSICAYLDGSDGKVPLLPTPAEVEKNPEGHDLNIAFSYFPKRQQCVVKCFWGDGSKHDMYMTTITLNYLSQMDFTFLLVRLSEHYKYLLPYLDCVTVGGQGTEDEKGDFLVSIYVDDEADPKPISGAAYLKSMITAPQVPGGAQTVLPVTSGMLPVPSS